VQVETVTADDEDEENLSDADDDTATVARDNQKDNNPSSPEMTKALYDEFDLTEEDRELGGASLTSVVDHRSRNGQLQLKCLWATEEYTWEHIKVMKEDYPLRTAQYIVNNYISK
jgi:hypothetical protein